MGKFSIFTFLYSLLKKTRKKKTKKTTTDVGVAETPETAAIDRISELPIPIQHHIMSFLDEHSAATTSLLSKHWNSVWNSSPTLQFVVELPGLNNRATAEPLVCSFDEALQSRIRCGHRIERFGIHIVYFFNGGVRYSTRVDSWLDLALRNGVREVSFTVYYHRFPENAFMAAEPVNRFDSLVKLSLGCVFLSESVVENIVNNCPNLEDFRLSGFLGLRDLDLYKLRKLETVRVHNSMNYSFHKIFIDSPSLKEFSFSRILQSRLIEIKLISCRDLRSLTLTQCDITDDWLHGLSRFPMLETLNIDDCSYLRRVRVSAPLLRTIDFNYCKNMETLEIDAPNLSSFHICAENLPVLSSNNVRCPMNVDYFFNSRQIFGTFDFFRLREMLRLWSVERKFLTLSLTNRWALECYFDELLLKDEVVPPVVNVEHLKLIVSSEKPIVGFNNLINGLLWSCRPNIISINCSTDVNQ